MTAGSEDEARVVLDLRDQRRLPADIGRPDGPGLGHFHSERTATVYDIVAVRPDRGRDLLRVVRADIEDRGRVVVLDTRAAGQAAIDEVRDAVREAGWSERVVWYP